MIKNSLISGTKTGTSREFKPNPIVLGRLAQAFYEKGSLKISYIHFVSRTTWSYLKKYLDWLQESNHVVYNKNDESYIPTQTGWEMFESITLFYEQADLKKKNTNFNLAN